MPWTKVLTADNPLHAGLAKITLEAAGLQVQLRQMELWSAAVEVLYSEGAAPSVWVPEAQAEQARQLLQAHQKKLQSQSESDQADWYCQHCREPNGSNFAYCWQCGQPSPDAQTDNPRQENHKLD